MSDLPLSIAAVGLIQAGFTLVGMLHSVASSSTPKPKVSVQIWLSFLFWGQVFWMLWSIGYLAYRAFTA